MKNLIKAMHKGVAIITLMAVIVVFVGCPMDVSPPPPPSGNIYAVDVREMDGGFDALLFAEDGSSALVEADESTGLPRRIYIMPEKGSDVGISIFFKENGLPDTMVYNGSVVYFGNFNGYTFDAAVIPEYGEIQYIRGIQTDTNFDTYFDGLDMGRSAGRGIVGDIADKKYFKAFLGAVGLGLGIAGCAAATAATGGFAALPCGVLIGSFVVQTTADILNITGVLNEIAAGGTDTAVGYLGFIMDTAGCALSLQLLDCISAFVSAAGFAADMVDWRLAIDKYFELEKAKDEIDGSGRPNISTSYNLPNGKAGMVYIDQRLTATGNGPFTWDIYNRAAFPKGLTLSKEGVIAGTPTKAGKYDFYVTATDTDGKTSMAWFIITIERNPQWPEITTEALPFGVVGEAYSQTLVARGLPTINWSIVDGIVPDGLTLTTEGASAGNAVIAGTPEKAGDFIFWVKAENALESDIKRFYIVITGGGGPIVPLEMVYVPGGSFEMGKNGAGTSSNETNMHTVTLTRGFYIGKYEVTQKQWQDVMGSLPSQLLSSTNYGRGDNYPVYYVNWYDALVFCNRLSMMEGLTPAYRINNSTDPAVWGTVPTSSNATWDAVTVVNGSTGYRLPTEAQWEYAAKGGNGSPGNYIYAGSNDPDEVAWYSGNNGSSGTPTYGSKQVGTLQANELGIHDMSGNVWEWCWDWYGTYPNGAQTDPVGASSGSRRVGRGGYWNSSAGLARSAYRNYYYPDDRDYHIGFRLVRPAQ